MERYIKSTFFKGFILFLFCMFTCCIAPRNTIQITDYILLNNGKEVLGKERGLTAFVFENNKRKEPFKVFAANKYGIGNYMDVEYWTSINGIRFKVLIYENSELQKYFDMSPYMATNQETEVNIVGSDADFVAVSVIDEYNNDCLDEASLYKQIVLDYLKNLKEEYNR